jgi:hypothetical protein
MIASNVKGHPGKPHRSKLVRERQSSFIQLQPPSFTFAKYILYGSPAQQ